MFAGYSNPHRTTPSIISTTSSVALRQVPLDAESWHLRSSVIEPRSETPRAGCSRSSATTETVAYCRIVPADEFSIICEVEPATGADLMHVRHQIGVMSRIASSFLIPDNHIGERRCRASRLLMKWR